MLIENAFPIFACLSSTFVIPIFSHNLEKRLLSFVSEYESPASLLRAFGMANRLARIVMSPDAAIETNTELPKTNRPMEWFTAYSSRYTVQRTKLVPMKVQRKIELSSMGYSRTDLRYGLRVANLKSE